MASLKNVVMKIYINSLHIILRRNFDWAFVIWWERNWFLFALCLRFDLRFDDLLGVDGFSMPVGMGVDDDKTDMVELIFFNA